MANSHMWLNKLCEVAVTSVTSSHQLSVFLSISVAQQALRSKWWRKLGEANDNIVVVDAFKESLGLPLCWSVWRFFLNSTYWISSLWETLQNKIKPCICYLSPPRRQWIETNSVMTVHHFGKKLSIPCRRQWKQRLVGK